MAAPDGSDERPRPRPWLRVGGALLVGAATLLVQLPVYDRSAVPMDEGHLASAASRLLAGDVLYRDIHPGIAPLIYHAVAVLFALFGSDLLVTRIAQVTVNVGVAMLLWLLALRVSRPHWALLASVLYVLLSAVGFPVLTMFNYSSLGLLLGLVSLLLLLVHLERGAVWSGVALGAVLATTALTKQNYGALCLVASGVALAWNRSPGSNGQPRPLIPLAVPVVVSGAAVALACTAYFAWRGALIDLVDSTLLQLAGSQFASFRNPIPPLVGEHPRDGRWSSSTRHPRSSTSC